MSSRPEFRQLRLRLRGDSSFHRLPSGLLIENDVQSLGLRGEGLHDLFSALAPTLDGQRTVDELLQQYPEDIRESIGSLLEILFDRTIVVHQPLEEEVELSAAEKARFREPLDLLTHLLERPMAGLRTVRSSRVLIAGSGPVLTAGATALLRYGIGTVHWLDLGGETPAQALDETVQGLASDGVRAEAHRFAGGLQDLSKSLDDYDLVLYACDHSTLYDLLILNRLCARDRIPLMPGLLFGTRAYLGPLLEPPFSGCWVCGLHRQSEDLFPVEQAMEFRQPAETPGRVFAQEMDPSPLLTRALGQGLAFETFKVLAGAPRVQCRQGILRMTEEAGQRFQSDLFAFTLGGCTGYCQPFLRKPDPEHEPESARRSVNA